MKRVRKLKRKKNANYCQCGCGQEIKIGNRFIQGHNSYGKKLSKEHKRVLFLANIGRKLTKINQIFIPNDIK